MQFKYGLIYRDVLRTPLIDVCLLMEMGTTNPLIGWFLQIFKDSAPEIVHPCPYDVNIPVDFTQMLYIGTFFCFKNVDIRNRSVVTKSFPHVFPSGDYKIFFRASTDNETIGNVMVVARLISSNKDTFG